MMMLRRTLYITRLMMALGLCVLLASWVSLLHLIKRAPLSHRQRFTQYGLAGLAAALPLRIQTYGAIPQQPALWLANHISWTDILVLGRCAPLSFLSKAEVRDWPLAGWLARQAGTLFIRRGNAAQDNVNGQLVDYLQQGRSLLIFPEGTTTDGRQTGTFYSRLLGCATATGLPIQPVAIRYRRAHQYDCIAPFIGDDELPQHLMRLLSHGPTVVEVHFLPLMDSQACSRTQLAHQVRQAITQVVMMDSGNEAVTCPEQTAAIHDQAHQPLTQLLNKAV